MSKSTISPYIIPGLTRVEGLKEELFTHFSVKPSEVLQIIANNLNVTVDDVLSLSRKREVVKSRQIFSGIMREQYKHTLTFIGGYLKKDHTTIIHSVEAYNQDKMADEAIEVPLLLVCA